MILLDTNLVSEPLRPKPDPRVIDWIDAQSLETLYLSVITVSELRAGIALLPSGKRRKTLERSLEQQVLPLFKARILPFDLASTPAYARLLAQSRASGQAIGMADACIAAIAATHQLTIATLDTASFKAAGLKTIDPWQ